MTLFWFSSILYYIVWIIYLYSIFRQWWYRCISKSDYKYWILNNIFVNNLNLNNLGGSCGRKNKRWLLTLWMRLQLGLRIWFKFDLIIFILNMNMTTQTFCRTVRRTSKCRQYQLQPQPQVQLSWAEISHLAHPPATQNW